MSLADHWSEGDYLPVGWHDCTVREFRVFKYNSGNMGVEFVLADSAGRTIKVAYCLVKSILWRLAKFASHCGLTEKDCKKYNPESDSGHRLLVGRRVMALVAKGKPNAENKCYNECAETACVETATQAPPLQTAAADTAAVAATSEDTDAPSGADIPF